MSAPSQAHARAIQRSTGWTRTPTSIYAVRRDLAHAEKGMLFLIDRFTRGFQRPWAPISVNMAMKYLGVTRQFVHETWKTLDELGYIRIRRPEHGVPEYQTTSEVTLEKSAITKCRDCQGIGPRKPVSGYVPTPHSLMN